MSLLLRRRLMMNQTAAADDGRWCYVIQTNYDTGGENPVVYYSSDFGETWQRCPGVRLRSSNQMGGIAVSPDGYGAVLDFSNWKVTVVGPDLPATTSSHADGSSLAGICVASKASSPGQPSTYVVAKFGSQLRVYTNGVLKASESFNYNPGIDVQAAACSDNGQYVIAGDLKSSDYGQTWYSINAEGSQSLKPNLKLHCMSADGRYQMAFRRVNVNDTAKLYFSSDWGNSWTAYDSTITASACAMNADGSKIFVSGKSGSVYGLFTGSVGAPGIFTTRIYAGSFSQKLSCNAKGDILLGTDGSYNVYRSVNGGFNWTLVREGGDGTGKDYVNAVICRGNAPLGGGIPGPTASADIDIYTNGGEWEQNEDITSWVSTNHDDDSSATLQLIFSRAFTDFQFSIANDSELDYDYVTAYLNGSEIQNCAGDPGPIGWTGDIQVGDELEIVYSKDGSTGEGSDEGFFTIQTSLSGVSVNIVD